MGTSSPRYPTGDKGSSVAPWVSSEEGPDQFGPDGNIHDSVFVSQGTRIDLYKTTPKVQLAGGAEGMEEGLMNGRVLKLSGSTIIHNTVSSSITLSTGSPQGCMLSLLLFTLLTYDCSARHPSCHIVKFADNTAVVGRITNSDES
ncbi:hypothetical protein CCH79_00013873 [Gambusia affinis]|uniref:Reverse transcriptase domain-containing protein n=1 Tax=Gambusia affinis TaxID=33528 RepID=A0A315VVJ2_GAMAF|nr:hypothetical protein CCH79_00013873 [Gambusia affinis]